MTESAENIYIGLEKKQLMSVLRDKMRKLREIVASLDSVLVAYSGGVDSTLLLKICVEELGKKAIAVTTVSESYPPGELEETARIAKMIGAKHLIIKTAELKDKRYAANTKDRCYFCKLNLYSELSDVAKRLHAKNIVNGTNADDVKDYRPGLKASGRFRVRSPLMEAGLTKEEITKAAKSLGLPNWNKPSSPCLASRIPYGTAVTIERLRMVGRAEAVLKKLGFRRFRVRFHNDCARIEVGMDEMRKAFISRIKVSAAIKKCGFKYIALDLEGYRSGSLNEGLKR